MGNTKYHTYIFHHIQVIKGLFNKNIEYKGFTLTDEI